MRVLDRDETRYVQKRINGDEEFRIAARFMSHDILFGCGERQCIVRVREGILTNIVFDPSPLDKWDFFVRAPEEGWELLLKAIPPPFYQGFFTAAMRENFQFGGDVEALFAYYWAIHRMLALFREMENEGVPAGDERRRELTASDGQGEGRGTREINPPLTAGEVEPIVGRYVTVEVHGVAYRIYFEESGSGIPLVCQHTASAEGLQWRHLLNDKDVTSRYRVIAVDLPYHGKSLPPGSVEWWKKVYKLTKSFFMDFHIGFSRALKLDRPVYLGCSIGGDIGLDLAHTYPDHYRAVITMGCADVTPGFDLVWWDHPRVGPHVKFADPFAAASPYAEERRRREVGWVLGKSSPQVFRGDSYYYSVEHNLEGKLHEIDTSRVAVYVLAGEYDFAATPEMGRETAKKIRGAHYVEMKKMGHFCMAEDYEGFKSYLMPVLNEMGASQDHT
jgi:pimeloyl-ACP methyl ester carboxylesterase